MYSVLHGMILSTYKVYNTLCHTEYILVIFDIRSYGFYCSSGFVFTWSSGFYLFGPPVSVLGPCLCPFGKQRISKRVELLQNKLLAHCDFLQTRQILFLFRADSAHLIVCLFVGFITGRNNTKV